MRAKPSKSCRLYWDVPVGSEVIVDEWSATDDGLWSRITWNDREGYMMREFLEEVDDPDWDTWTVTIPGLTKAQAEELCAEWSEATMKRG